MKFEKAFNPIEGFDLQVLNDPDFKEDSVREEIIFPILKALGYGAARPHKIIRSKGLVHPFVSIGSARKNITCIPDYLIEVECRYAWVLEAKGPNENILSGKHVEQAYSYAIHSEIRVPLFSLCNGREFVLFHISSDRPLLHFKIESLPVYFESLAKYLAPKNVLNSEFKLAKDLGLHLRRLGFQGFSSIVFPDVPVSFIGQLDPDMFTTATGMEIEDGCIYAMSLDFDEKILDQMSGKIPSQAIEMLKIRTGSQRQVVQFPDGSYKLTLDCHVGVDLQENSDEIFLPFIINRVL
ncbi:type I restriction enzyme HsdR N-terminal domain-containing protein [Pseudomonas otitidis]|uniref:type I restriction enzyme HsdR N-terminal domain-containing protein n=1 Tax=Metapseudomonas otitidis TaxID=319939 RepID=UPI00244862D3|nr:type I restriction enzyme HsdR N-terminal domain-containing protein [Pseudomonas otitidis]MDH1107118.1 type I restriction enzyme HsdR N-terminal domain-containing protein [Pseudomonas otitidis]MDH1161544.1 type I restriction enzyme HsdR N-terminal domain-containing protein [Pseudomonas otitidis]MDH1165175.1 type I restriction enzyme HsdR N-terminal domain-containing protein [Pseudomonas otitidis]